MKKKVYLVIASLLVLGIFFLYFQGEHGRIFVTYNMPQTETESREPSFGDDIGTSVDFDDVDFEITQHGYNLLSKEKRDTLRKSYLVTRDGAEAKITFHVVDSTGKNVPEATIKTTFGVFEKPTTKTGKTDINGMFVWDGITDGGVIYTVQRDGYYRTQSVYVFSLDSGNDVINGKWKPWNPTVSVTLKEKRTPIPMYVKSVGIRLPQKGETFGFDFEKGDLVTPHGQGEHADMLLRCWGDKPIPLTHAVSRYLILSYKTEDEGFIRKNRDTQSIFHSLHEAPDNGYEQETNLCYRRTNDKVLENNEFPQNEYLIFRSRVELDDEGKIVKAHYGKIFDIWFDISANNLEGAAVRFLYYFNPAPNDHSIEFDPSQNLFGNDRRENLFNP